MIRIRITAFLSAVLMLAVLLSGCGYLFIPPVEVDYDVIRLEIRLDLKEDIGLLIVDHSVNGQQGSGGVSNADRSMLKKNEVLYWDFERKQLEVPSDVADITVSFSIVTKYFEPNYDNDYPDEYVLQTDPISIHAFFGETFRVKVTGDKISGYIAVLESKEK